MATIVLVHGAWHGGWCWRRVAPRLRAAGHEVYTPTLTGLGERSHLRPEDLDLDTHIQDIVNVFDYEDLEAVTLVGHSYGGMVVTGVADRVSARIASIVYLDAYVGHDGKSLLDIAGSRPDLEGDHWAETDRTFGVTGPDDLAWLRTKQTAHPLRTMNTKLNLAKAIEDHDFPLTYVLAAGETTGILPTMADGLRDDERWRVIDLPTGHDMMVTMPEEVTQIILASVGSVEPRA